MLTAKHVIKKCSLLVISILGIFLCSPSSDAISEIIKNERQNPAITLKTRPDFIKLHDWGVSVSVGSPYDIIHYGRLYYICINNTWYRSLDCNWPWFVMEYRHLPALIRRLGSMDIKRIREAEYTKHDFRSEESRRFVRNNHENNIISGNESARSK
ncbi:MAG: hypothetical protein FDX30_06945 [Chlorobium sp.]|nr:MAG: hypothetical protein FDX30_06945 [Chlorobium sp.]